jgi:hypothetical protein
MGGTAAERGGDVGKDGQFRCSGGVVPDPRLQWHLPGQNGESLLQSSRAQPCGLALHLLHRGPEQRPGHRPHLHRRHEAERARLRERLDPRSSIRAPARPTVTGWTSARMDCSSAFAAFSASNFSAIPRYGGGFLRMHRRPGALRRVHERLQPGRLRPADGLRASRPRTVADPRASAHRPASRGRGLVLRPKEQGGFSWPIRLAGGTPHAQQRSPCSGPESEREASGRHLRRRPCKSLSSL